MSALPIESVVTPAAVLLASLAGSLHCAGMCGPIALGVTPRPETQIAYHVARGLSYVLLGAIAGAVGSVFFVGKWTAWFAVLSLVAYFAWSAYCVVRGRREPVLFPAAWTKLVDKPLGHFFPKASRQWTAAFATGALTAFLPCGWLHLFLASAVATGSAARGAFLMAVFWVGTVPALVGGRWLFGKLVAPAARRRPVLVGALLILAALSVLTVRGAHLFDPGPVASCHDGK